MQKQPNRQDFRITDLRYPSNVMSKTHISTKEWVRSSRFQTHHQRGGRGVIYWKKRNNTYAALVMLHTTTPPCNSKIQRFFGRKISMWYWIQCRTVCSRVKQGQMQSYCDHLSNCKKRRKLYGDIFSWKLWQNYNSICIFFPS